MQLTKDDVKTDSDIKENYDEFGREIQYLDFSKFQQVVEFYEKYRYRAYELLGDFPIIFRKWEKAGKSEQLHIWLFNYCFVEGLE